MNITAGIFAFLILFLSVQQPVLRSGLVEMQDTEMSFGFCSKMASTCSSKKEKEEDTNKGNCCQECVCNPFGSCCCYLPAEKISYQHHYRINNTRLIPQNENILSSYISDFWQPPESVSFL